MPYSVGLHAAVDSYFSSGVTAHLAIGSMTLLMILIFVSSWKSEEEFPQSLPGCRIFHIAPFFRRRYGFLNWGFQVTGQNSFQFKLLRHTVFVVSGESARQTFFTAKGLDLTEGFKMLSTAIPMVKGVTSDLQTRRIALIHKRLSNIQRTAPLSSLIPHLLQDTKKVMEGWGTSGTFDPFENVYELIFQLNIRSLSCEEVSEKPMLVNRLKKLYDILDNGTTPVTVLIPWLPTPAMIKKLWATKEIYEIVVQAIEDRERSGISRNDTLQTLMDSGDEKLVIIGFIMGLIIAGARATGTTASWLMTFLGGHPEWRAKAAIEVEYLISYHSTPPSDFPMNDPVSTSTSSHSLAQLLSAVPLEAWEVKTPVLDALIRETTRVAQPHAAMRRNLGPELYINGKLIPTGAYVIYPFSDVHLDPELYPDPWKFDPGRKEITHIPFAYVGWGGGKTNCLGTRLAKIQLKVVTAMFVLGFKHSSDRQDRPSG